MRWPYLVVAKRLEGERPQDRPFLGEHGRDLPLGGAVDAGVGPAGLPAIEIGLGVGKPRDAQPAERRLLRMADPGVDFAFPIGIANPARQRDRAVVREDVAIERIERRVVDVGGEDAFFQVVEVVCPLP